MAVLEDVTVLALPCARSRCIDVTWFATSRSTIRHLALSCSASFRVVRAYPPLLSFAHGVMWRFSAREKGVRRGHLWEQVRPAREGSGEGGG